MVSAMWEEKNRKISAALIKPLDGLRFGKLTILRFVEIRNHSAYWLCKCDCGAERTIIASSLNLNGTKSCGCIRKGEKRKVKSLPLEERFWPKVQKSEGCWLWTAYVDLNGYGEMHLKSEKGRCERAHRVSWMINRGPIPEGMDVLHKCDNPPCVNPDHLFLGTQKDNVLDCIKKGRNPTILYGPGLKGEQHGMSKLTEKQVIDIRHRYVAGVNAFYRSNKDELAKEFGISPNHIWQICKGRVWKHLL